MTHDDDDRYPDKPGHVRGSDTSEAAADSIDAETMQARVLECIRGRGAYGTTDDELEVLLEMRHQTCSARRRELELKGLVFLTPNRRLTRSGSSAGVYSCIPQPAVEPEPVPTSPPEPQPRPSRQASLFGDEPLHSEKPPKCGRCGGRHMFRPIGTVSQSRLWLCMRCDRPSRWSQIEQTGEPQRAMVGQRG